MIPGKKYKIFWIDAAGDAGWNDEKDLDEYMKKMEKGVEQELIYIKESKLLYAFTTGKHLGDGNYTDIHLIPKAWCKIKRIK